MTSPTGKFSTGVKGGIADTAVQMDVTDISCAFGVLIKAYAGNDALVYVGPKGVTAGTGDNTCGYPLAAGEEIFIPVDYTGKIYLIAGQVPQSVFFMAA